MQSVQPILPQMMEPTFWENMAEVSWLYYFFLFCLLKIAYRRTKPILVSTRLLLFSFVYTTLFLAGVTLYFFHYSWLNTLALLVSFITGIVLGFTWYTFRRITITRNTAQFYIPGSWIPITTFCLFVIFLFYPMNNSFIKETYLLFKQSNGFTTFGGLITGIALGRATYLLRCIKYGPWHDPA